MTNECVTNERVPNEYLCEGGGRGGPALVQHAAWEVPAQRLQEGAAHVVQEVVVVWAVLLVAVDEALNQPIRAQDMLLTHQHTLNTEGLIMVPRSCNAMTTQTLRRSRDGSASGFSGGGRPEGLQ